VATAQVIVTVTVPYSATQTITTSASSLSTVTVTETYTPTTDTPTSTEETVTVTSTLPYSVSTELPPVQVTETQTEQTITVTRSSSFDGVAPTISVITISQGSFSTEITITITDAPTSTVKAIPSLISQTSTTLQTVTVTAPFSTVTSTYAIPTVITSTVPAPIVAPVAALNIECSAPTSDSPSTRDCERAVSNIRSSNLANSKCRNKNAGTRTPIQIAKSGNCVVYGWNTASNAGCVSKEDIQSLKSGFGICKNAAPIGQITGDGNRGYSFSKATRKDLLDSGVGLLGNIF
jgi:hypothetical protein